MSSPEPSAQATNKPLGPVRPAFDWIELLILPIAIGIMEAQIVITFLLFIGAFFIGATSLPIDAITITGLLVGLRIWSQLVKTLTLRGMSPLYTKYTHALGLAIAIETTLVIYPTLIHQTGALILCGILITGFWYRSIGWVMRDLHDEPLVLTFRIGFIILLFVVSITVFLNAGMDERFQSLVSILPQSLPLFFFSGVLALSFTRLDLIRRDTARKTPGKNTTHLWLIVLTIVWIIIIAAAIGLEAFSFDIVQQLLIPLWNFLGIILYWIFTAIAWIIYTLASWLGMTTIIPSRLNPNTSNGRQPPPQRPQQPAYTALSPEWLLFGRLLIIAISLIILVYIVRLVIRQWNIRQRTENEEIRESLSVSEILRTRRQEREQQHKEAFQLEPLDPESARARYRELLQAMAQTKNALSKRAEETPDEYRLRLQRQEDTATDSDTLRELTQAYERERYGGQSTPPEEATHLRLRVPALIERLTKKLSET